jgi:hypothetical protein
MVMCRHELYANLCQAQSMVHNTSLKQQESQGPTPVLGVNDNGGKGRAQPLSGV